MKKFFIAASLVLGLTSISSADTNILVNKATQRMTISSGFSEYVLKVSTAGKGHFTPTGIFHPYSLEVMHHSHKYNNAPMPHSIFYSGGYAIHATNAVGNLGRPASHGCVRLSPHDAKLVFDLVRNDRNTTIKVVDR